MEEQWRAGRAGVGVEEWLVPERQETNTGRGGQAAAAFEFTCLPSPGKEQIETAQDIIFRAIFKQCG